MATANGQQNPTTDQDVVGEEEETEIHVDVLETIFTHVPLIHLASASEVSTTWLAAVQSSLRHHNKPKPWLILHVQSTRAPHSITTRAYDPRSDMWMSLTQPLTNHTSNLKNSDSNFLHALSPSKFAFSSAQLKLNWRHVDPPKVWRVDPIVARVGYDVVIAGGACDFEDEPLAVEIYCLKTGVWRFGKSMPEKLKDYADSASLSIATWNKKLIVTVKSSGLTYWFDPKTGSWSEPVVLDPGRPGIRYHIGCASDELVLIGVFVTGDTYGVKVWRVKGDDFECEEVGEMPMEYVHGLKNESWGFGCMETRVAGNIVYMYNTWVVEELFACELTDDGACRWWRVRNAVTREELIGKRVVYASYEVGIKELSRVSSSNVVKL